MMLSSRLCLVLVAQPRTQLHGRPADYRETTKVTGMIQLLLLEHSNPQFKTLTSTDLCSRPGLAGQGYGDGDLKHQCQKCSLLLTHDVLRLSKFYLDTKLLATQDQAMPGTIIDPKSGLPKLVSKDNDDRLFPSRLIRRGLLVEIAETLKPGAVTTGPGASMSLVKDLVENATAEYTSGKTLRRVDDKRGLSKLKDVATPKKLSLAARRQTRKMMSRYWQNWSFAALDLSGAILRQGVFSEKMCKVSYTFSSSLF